MAMVHFTLVVLVCFAIIPSFAQIGRSGSNQISYHIYGNGQIYGACDYYNQVSKYGGYITANTLGLDCFACVQMQSGGNTIYVTVVDTGGENFDLNEPAFIQLCGQAGINAGHCNINWVVVSPNNCIGNPNGGQSNPPPPPPPPANPPPPPPAAGGSTGGTVRCGSSWTNAQNKCGTSCTNDAQCSGGEHCYADLTYCSGGSSPPSSSSSNKGPRCGQSWTDANSKCGNACTDDSQCNGEHCYADLSLTPCGGSAHIDSEFEFVAAVTDTDQTQSTGNGNSLPVWLIGLIVLGSVVMVLAIAVTIQIALLLRN